MPYKDKKKQREYSRKWQKQYRKNHMKECQKYDKLIRESKNRQEYIKEYRQKYKEHINEYRKKYRHKNKKHSNNLKRYKYKTDLKFNLNTRISTAINVSLKGKKNGRHWESLVGYSLADLIRRLKFTMPMGYNWKDYLSGKLHIDHITPIVVFNFTEPEHTDFKKCWGLKNLRLLPVEKNLKKGSNLSKPFQPSLLL